jgi:hypothetical protein
VAKAAPEIVYVCAPCREPTTPRTTAWMVLQLLADLRRYDPELDESIALAGASIGLVRYRAPDRLDPRLNQPVRSALRPLRRFAKHLSADYDADYDAVRAAVTAGLEQRPGRGPDQSPESPQASDVWPHRSRPARPQVPARSVIIESDTGGEFEIHRLFTGRQLGKPALAGTIGLVDERRGGHGGRAAEFATSVESGQEPTEREPKSPMIARPAADDCKPPQIAMCRAGHL